MRFSFATAKKVMLSAALLWFGLGLVACESQSAEEQLGIDQADFARFVLVGSVCQRIPVAESIWMAAMIGAGAPDNGALGSYVACMASATTCPETLVCGGAEIGAECDPATFKPRCDQNTAVVCQPWHDGKSSLFSHVCGTFFRDGGDKCLIGYEGLPVCGTGLCGPVSELGTITECQGSVEQTCSATVAGQFDCSSAGESCEISEDHEVYGCTPKDEVCQEPGTYCKGNTVVRCLGDGLAVYKLDCGLVGYVCQDQSGNGDADCLPPGADGGEEYEPSCSGSVFRTCSSSGCFSIDCSDFMGATCGTCNGYFGTGPCCKSDQWIVPDVEPLDDDD